MSKYTPGPWKLVAPSLRGMERTVVAEGKDAQPMQWVIAHVSESMNIRGHVLNGEANARLIEAAPEMLNALKCLVARFEIERPDTTATDCECNQFHDQGDCRHTLALRAIAKAEG
jgi:hypothetical protein